MAAFKYLFRRGRGRTRESQRGEVENDASGAQKGGTNRDAEEQNEVNQRLLMTSICKILYPSMKV